jgi:oligosaccharide repeat unit polymerase
LLLDWRDLYSSLLTADPIGRIVLLETQELAYYVTRRLEIPLGVGLARASAVAAIFVVSVLVGYRLVVGRWLARRLARVRGGGAPRNAPAAIAAALAIGIAAQTAIIARAGGPAASLESANEQNALSDSFVLYLLAGFGLVALIVWVAWRAPQSRAEWVGLVLAIAATCGFAMLAGSRARVFVTLLVLAFVVHYVHRRWRWRELVAVGVVLLAFASSFGVFRQVADNDSLGTAARLASEHMLDGRVILNDTTSFDHLIYATTIYGQPDWIERARPHEHGQFLLDGVLSYVPSSLYPDKPEGGDVAFRKVVWGDDFGAGRPPTAAGDLFIDFGLPGVAVGALLIGIAAQALLGLIGGGAEGHRYRVALFAVLTMVLYEFVEGTFSIALGFAITMLIPLLITVHGLGRLPWPAARGPA